MLTEPRVAAGFTALGDDEVCAVFDCELRLAYGRDLLHDEAAGIVDPFHEVSARVVERERDDGGSTLKRRGKRVCVEIRNDVIHREGTFRQVAKLGELAPELVGRTVPRTETAERASVRDRCRQRGRREDAHPRLDDRNLNTDQITQWRTHPTTFQPQRLLLPTSGQLTAVRPRYVSSLPLCVLELPFSCEVAA